MHDLKPSVDSPVFALNSKHASYCEFKASSISLAIRENVSIEMSVLWKITRNENEPRQTRPSLGDQKQHVNNEFYLTV